MKNELFEQFRKRLVEFGHFGSASALLHWDQETYMPKGGNAMRSQTISFFHQYLHDLFLASEFVSMLKELKARLDAGALNEDQGVIVREVWRDYEREVKLPSDFVKELSHVIHDEGIPNWMKAREESRFEIFLPTLKKLVELKRKEARFLGFQDVPYDPLLDNHEPYATTKEVERVLGELKDFLVPFLQKILQSSLQTDVRVIQGHFPIEKQKVFAETVIREMGYDMDRGRMDVTVHPFSTMFNPYDCRITTRYYEDNLFECLRCAIHESGHAIYNQGLPAEHFGTPLAEANMVGIHESQSRLWEYVVGHAIPFWRYFYPKLQSSFPEPFQNIAFDDFYRVINKVSSGFIRVEADEVTYNLHIILRFELEQALIDGSLEVEDLPKAWNMKMKEYLGLDVPNDAQGVLQDIHWSYGAFGYFPTYALGNLYSAQIYEAVKRTVPDVEKKIVIGDFKPLLGWLRENIHWHGRRYAPLELIKRATGEEFTSKYFVQYLAKKYGEIYQMNKE